MTRFCFIRHGETDWNVALRMQGHVDIPLNATGLAQAEALGRRFASGTIQAEALYCSDLIRAQQTAQPVAAALGLPIITTPQLRERSFGCCEGLVFDEIVARFPAEAAAIKRRDPDHVPAGGESRRQHQVRIRDCVNELAACHPVQTLVVVTHGGVLDVVYRFASALAIDAPRTYPIANASLNWVVVDDQKWQIEAWADVTHLTAVLPVAADS